MTHNKAGPLYALRRIKIGRLNAASLLILLALVFAITESLWVIFLPSTNPALPVDISPAVLADKNIAVYTLDSKENYSSVTSKPLFTVNRMPYIPPPPMESAPAIQETVANPTPEREVQAIDFQVQGIIRTPHLKMVLLQDSNGNIVRLSANDTIAGWRISDIQENTVLLENEDAHITLPFSREERRSRNIP